MNYLLLAPELFIGDGGIARILRLYLKALCELSGADERVRFLSLNDAVVDSAELRRYSADPLVEWEVCNRSKVSFVRGAVRMGFRSDLIVCGHIGQLPVAWLIAMVRPRVRYYLVAHGIEVWRPFSMLERRALKGASGIFCVSNFTRRRLLENCPLPDDKVAVVYNALDPNRCTTSSLAVPDGPPIILSVSRITIADSYKGIDHLVEAMPSVCAAIPDARLRVVGRGDGLARLQAIARRLKIERSIEFVGYRSDSELENDFESCRLFALPSEKEGFGLVYLEAMAHGRPCLGARSGGVPEVISDVTGILVEYGHVEEIASGVISALRRDWDPAAMLERAREFSYLRFKGRLASLLST